MDDRVTQLENEVKELRDILDSIITTIGTDPQFIRSIGEALVSTSGKVAASATQSVDEAGSATYDVMYPPDGFITIAGKNVPYID